MKPESETTLMIRLPLSLKKAVQKAAQTAHMPVSLWVRQVLRDKVGQ